MKLRAEIFIQCEKSKTFFNAKAFKKQNGVEVTETVLYEMQKASEKSVEGKWELNNLILNSEKTYLSISDPIFDSNQKHSVISVTYWKYVGSAYGQTFFLKKVYGKWTIIFTYDYWLT